jgi:lysine-N-methylase
MSLPVRHLPVVQNWDCHVCGSCCKEYLVTVTDEERRRLEAQGWDKDALIGGQPLFRKSGPWWARKYHLNSRDDGSCVFLSEQGRCRVHEKFGYATKPLPCRLFPFVLVPTGDHWRVGIRFACPSSAANKGRPVSAHEASLREFAALLARREGLDDKPAALRPPRLQGRLRLDWPDLLRLVDTLSSILKNRKDHVERRLRKCLALAELCRQARLDHIKGQRLVELIRIFIASLENEVPADPSTLPQPNWVGRVLFRQSVALFTRKDHGPDSGLARGRRLALLVAALRFARGRGPVPRMHKKIPETTFDQIEAASTPQDAGVEEILERYYTIKIESLQFCGAANLGLSVWDGFEVLALTYPLLMWVTRAMRDVPPTEAVTRALTIVDDHFGFNPVLGTLRQRIGFRLLGRTGQLPRLIAWYGR